MWEELKETNKGLVQCPSEGRGGGSSSTPWSKWARGRRLLLVRQSFEGKKTLLIMIKVVLFHLSTFFFFFTKLMAKIK